MEPRARASRHKSGLNFGTDLEQMLQAFGAPHHPDFTLGPIPGEQRPNDPDRYKPYPETVRVLDEIVTDFIIETCHDAVAIASYSGRAKLKLADFEWAVRKDKNKLGHVHSMMQKKRDIDSKRKVFNVADVGGDQTKIAVDDMQLLGGAVGEEGTGKGKGRGRGKRKKRKRNGIDDTAEGQINGEDSALVADEDGDDDETGKMDKGARSMESE